MRWGIVGLLTLATVINYLDRSCLSVAAPTFMPALGIDKVHYSWIVNGFIFSYMVFQPLAGRLMDSIGARRGFVVSVSFWSVANMLHGLATGWRSFAFFRGLLGTGEAGMFPGAGKVVAEWFPPKERTIATGLFNVGTSLGAMLAPPLVAWIIWKTKSWQAAFVATGAIGFLWVALWLLVYRAPPAAAPAPDLAELRAPGGWREVVSRRDFWGLALARFLAEPAWQFFVYWIPIYLVDTRNLDLKGVAAFAWVPFLAGDFGCLFGGVLSPLFLRAGVSLLTARKLAATTSAAIMTGAVFIGTAPTATWAIAFFCVGAFAHQSLSSTLLTLPADLFPARSVATASGLAGGIGHLGGWLFTFGIGYTAQHVGFQPIFMTIAVLDLIGAALLWALVREPRGAARAGTA